MLIQVFYPCIITVALTFLFLITNKFFCTHQPNVSAIDNNFLTALKALQFFSYTENGGNVLTDVLTKLFFCKDLVFNLADHSNTFNFQNRE